MYLLFPGGILHVPCYFSRGFTARLPFLHRCDIIKLTHCPAEESALKINPYITRFRNTHKYISLCFCDDFHYDLEQ